jgi:DNA-binding NarL/FixJ family response regulator
MNKIRIFVADDHTLFRQGLITLLQKSEKIQVVGWAGNGRDTLEMIFQAAPDILIADISMPLLNGLQVARKLKKQMPSLKIILLTMYKSTQYIRAALNLDLGGYVLKEDAFEDLLEAVHQVLQGRRYFSPALEKCVVDANNVTSELILHLTPREKEVFRLLGNGLVNKQIAVELKISVKTVESHRCSIMKKLDMDTPAELVRFAIESKLVGELF